ncbi:MAG: formate dehydrogenase N subunit beta transmembrane domain-containing protein, partial [Billgrantia desiderata]
GIVDFNSEHCIGCGYCVTGCPFDVPRISEVDGKSYKCTLCSDRVFHGLEPACVKSCPTGSIMFGTRDDMLDLAETRTNFLKSRGFDNAGVYNPEGVDGTHVIYVLQHADKPGIYSALPENPSISPMVSAWKGVTKPLASAAIGLAALTGFLHYATAGPKEHGEDDEQAVRDDEARQREREASDEREERP